MERIQWACPAPMGIPLFDIQHLELHERLRGLLTTLESDPNGALSEYRFIQLSELTAEHFQAEEDYLQAVGYPDLAVHRWDHLKILERFRSDLARWRAPGAPPLSDLVAAFAQAVQTHLEKADRGFALWLESRSFPGIGGGRAGLRRLAP